MAGSSTEERGKRAGENGEQRKEKKGKREKEIVKKKKKNLKKGLVCPFFYSMKCEKHFGNLKSKMKSCWSIMFSFWISTCEDREPNT